LQSFGVFRWQRSNAA